MACISTTHSAPGVISVGRSSTRVMMSFQSGKPVDVGQHAEKGVGVGGDDARDVRVPFMVLLSVSPRRR